MDKNSIIGFVLIAVIMMGFFGYQSRQQAKLQKEQARLDSIAAAEAYEQYKLDSAYRAQHPEAALPEEAVAPAAAAPAQAVYSDSLLNAAALADASYVTLENEKLEVKFTTRGGQPWSVRVKDYCNYDKSDLYLIPEGQSQLGYVVYAPTAVDTRKFNFQYVEEESSDSTVVMRLPFAGGGYIEQRYTLRKDTYSLNETVSFVGMQNLIPHNVNSIDVDFEAVIPRPPWKGRAGFSRKGRDTPSCHD